MGSLNWAWIRGPTIAMLKHYGNACCKLQAEKNSKRLAHQLSRYFQRVICNVKQIAVKCWHHLHDIREIMVAEVSFFYHLIAKQIQITKPDEVDICHQLLDLDLGISGGHSQLGVNPPHTDTSILTRTNHRVLISES